MIVQPTPTAPRTPVRRGLRVAALAVPVVLLAGAVAIGVAGPRSTPAVDTSAQGPAASSAPAAVAVPGEVPSPAPARPAFPTVAADLGVRTIAEAQAWLEHVTPGPIAVAGWLVDLHPLGSCAVADGDTRGVLGPMCPRRARLVGDPSAESSANQIYLTIPVGTRLPPDLERAGELPAATPIEVVGHTGDLPHPCVGDPNECRSDLLVERVTWADGAAFDPGPVFDTYLGDAPAWLANRNLESAETLAIGWYGTILQAALVRPSTVARIDPAAARVMHAPTTPGTLVWYVRGLETGYDPVHALHGEAPPRYSWVVLDYDTGATLARGPKRPPASP